MGTRATEEMFGAHASRQMMFDAERVPDRRMMFDVGMVLTRRMVSDAGVVLSHWVM
ncbi:hypothetical protein [Mycetohabitans rhizoxinica]|uniref:hypothetical protein n=1 Tax=Mycetohabitans rhizoxinica TaxID=412963 RepID=UPI0030D4350A